MSISAATIQKTYFFFLPSRCDLNKKVQISVKFILKIKFHIHSKPEIAFLITNLIHSRILIEKKIVQPFPYIVNTVQISIHLKQEINFKIHIP